MILLFEFYVLNVVEKRQLMNQGVYFLKTVENG